jgi:hypothetical protein
VVVSERRQQWLRAQVLISQTMNERADLVSALGTSRLGYLLGVATEGLSVEAAGKCTNGSLVRRGCVWRSWSDGLLR